MKSPKRKSLILLSAVILIMSCAGGREFSLAPVKTRDPDNKPIPPPQEREENQIWDILDMTFFYQIEKLLNLNWSARKAGKMLNVAEGRPADNVNALDEVPDCSWYTNRHFHNRMSPEELALGPNITDGPDQSGPWVIVRGKFEGGTPGFTIKDARGDFYLLKFDAPRYQEMGSSAEVISTKILYACGYNVPQNTIEYFDPNILEVGETAKVTDKGFRRPMTLEDVKMMLNAIPTREDGKIRVLASKFVDGKPVGVWNYIGTRRDDPNDLVHHQHRRELRGLRVISSWLNDADRRAANTLAVYTPDKYIKHYLIDMGSTLGSNNIMPHAAKYGNEYLWDPRSIGWSFVALGIYVKPWEFETGFFDPEYSSVGYFESEIFDPGRWVPTYPNPAFEHATLRDAYWGAKIVTSFSDEAIRAIVATAKMSNPEAEQYLIKTLIERRDKIGRYWFERMNPLDKFHFERNENELALKFSDLAVDGNLESAETTQYIYTLSYKKNGRHRQTFVAEPAIPISLNGHGFLDAIVSTDGVDERGKIFSVKIQTQREGVEPGKAVEVFFYYPGPSGEPRVLGIRREE